MGTFSNGISYYDFHKSCRQVGYTKHLIEKFIYSLKSPKTHRIYVAEVEHYDFGLYAIKFYLKANKDSKNRFNMLTGLNEGRPVIHTCIAIMVEIFHQDNLASFAFIGSPSPKEIAKENENPKYIKEYNTKRFRIYKMLMSTYFSSDVFEHRNSIRHSLYLMRNINANYTVKQIQAMINDIYQIDIDDFD